MNPAIGHPPAAPIAFPLARPFGRLPTGEPVEVFSLANAHGVAVDILTWGGIVSALRVPDREGRIGDVVLGFDSFDRYLAGHPNFGAMVGRVAGRITGARFTLEGRTYALARNEPPNHLHGGVVGFDKRLWRAEPMVNADGDASLRLTYHSPDGEEGYPGAVDVTVVYTVTASNMFIVETQAVSDRVTPINLTHHSYFNLAGEGSGTIDDHMLQIDADEVVQTDERMALLGRRVPVAGQPNDFNEPRRLGEAVAHLFKRHGDLYLVRRPAGAGGEGALIPVACVTAPGTGRVLDVSTTERCLQFYTGVSLDGALVGKSRTRYGPHAAFCLECHGYPDAVSTPGFGDILARPGRPRRSKTVYAFSTAVS